MISYFLTTQVKGKTISTVEKAADFCLQPAQYLWNGKKVDWIQEGPNKAIQIDFIYTPEERSWPMAALMIVLLIPGTILGAALKGYAFCRHHQQENDVFIKKCLNREWSKQVFCPSVRPSVESAFGKKIRDLIITLRSTSSINPDLADKGKPLFLSEITDITLRREHHHSPMFANHGIDGARVNREILDNIHLLWNLSYIDVCDHFAQSSRRSTANERGALIEMNPFVKGPDTQPVRAVDFFTA